MKNEIKRTVVKSMNGLYDEEAVALTTNIAARRTHPFTPHEWINASLHFERNSYNLSIENRTPPKGFGPAWGTAYGGIRYCKKCKQIDCIHLWGEETSYEVKQGEWYSVHYHVAACKICSCRVLRGSFGESKPSVAAQQLIAQTLEDLRLSELTRGRYGSGWVCELPVVVSQILATQGESAALNYILDSIGSGSCQDAIDRVHHHG